MGKINEKLEKEEIEELEMELNNYLNDVKNYNRLNSVLMVKEGETRKKVAKYAHVHENTVGDWVKKYNNGGIDALVPDYSNCGAESKLTENQLQELHTIICTSDKKFTVRDVWKLIIDKYGINYSMKQVWMITRKKMELGYKKPFIVYNEAPENAEEIFKKKTSKIDIEKEDLVITDESRCQNTQNLTRVLYDPVYEENNKPTVMKRTSSRFGVNAIGFQGVNTTSAIFFTQKNNSNNYAKTLCEYQLTRIENPNACKLISDAITNPNIDITNIKLELLHDALEDDEYYELFKDDMVLDYKKLESSCKQNNINYYKINRIQKERLLHNLCSKELIDSMNNETRLNIVLDNARIHKSKVVAMVCEILNINLIFLPPYCPFLNPIEIVWRDTKREVYRSYYENLEELTEIFEDAFMSRVYSESYYQNWLKKFFSHEN